MKPKYEGRVALYDNPVNNTFTVILNQLTDSDKGYYWCMTDEIREQQSSTELKIIDGTSWRGGTSLPPQEVPKNLLSTRKKQVWLLGKRREVQH